MKVLITGICGFVGAAIARYLVAAGEHEVFGMDNLIRAGSHLNRVALSRLGIRIIHGDIRAASDLAGLPAADWLIDASANPSVLAGADGQTSSRQLLEHNLAGTINLLEYCKQHRAGFILLSTSRVYAVDALSSLPVELAGDAYQLNASSPLPPGVSPRGIDESFSTAPPLSLYGSSKLCSELLALEYGALCNFPVWIDRCGVLAGAGQFGRADQGIFSFWIHSWKAGQPLRYIGFNGHGPQVRDAFHPQDLARFVSLQMDSPAKSPERIVNLGGGRSNARSLAQLSKWCTERFGPREVASDSTPRRFDVPWLVMDSSKATSIWNWQPQITLDEILEEIAIHAETNPGWLAETLL